MQECTEQDKMLKEEVDSLVEQKQQQIKRNSLTYKNASIWNDANYQPTKIIETNKHSFNLYADKLLIHLVIEEKFNYEKISQIMAYTFRHEANQFSVQACRQRWYELHRDRQILPQIKEKQMQTKRIKSIMNMNDPFLLYNVEQKLQSMQKDENHPSNELTSAKQLSSPTYNGYNIFKDSIRKIDDLEKYHELQTEMRKALDKASTSVQLEKPMLYTPYYDRLQQFQVLEEELTLEKMQQMMSHPIEMELMERELKTLDLNERNFESKVKKDVDKKVKQEKIRNQEEFQIEEDWDQYESD